MMKRDSKMSARARTRHTKHSRIAVRRSRRGAGLGLFATHAIKKGEVVVEYTGRHIPTKVADTLGTRYLFELNSEWTIDGSARSNIARYINHSCDPNCEADDVNGKILIIAFKDIAAGEEITYDYGEEYFDQFIKPKGCLCTSCTKDRALQMSVVQ